MTVAKDQATYIANRLKYWAKNAPIDRKLRPQDPCYAARYAVTECTSPDLSFTAKMTIMGGSVTVPGKTCKTVWKRHLVKCADLLITNGQSPWRKEVRAAMANIIMSGEGTTGVSTFVGAVGQLVGGGKVTKPPWLGGGTVQQTTLSPAQVRGYLNQDKATLSAGFSAGLKSAAQLSRAGPTLATLLAAPIMMGVPSPTQVDRITGGAPAPEPDLFITEQALQFVMKEAHGIQYRAATPEMAQFGMVMMLSATLVGEHKFTSAGQPVVGIVVTTDVGAGPTAGPVVAAAVEAGMGLIIVSGSSVGSDAAALVVPTVDIRVAGALTALEQNAVIHEPAGGWPAPGAVVVAPAEAKSGRAGLYLGLGVLGVAVIGGGIYAATRAA